MLNWTAFEGLPGTDTRNFEIVVRAAITSAYARCGRMHGTRQQPGVEFYLRIEEPGCALGDRPRVFGWQCRYYGDDGYLTATRRAKVTDAIEKAIKYVDGITDFVLCTRKALSQTDAGWLESEGDRLGVKCHKFCEDDLEGLMVGDAASLMERFFGEVVITEDQLLGRYEESLEVIRDRYEPQLHLPRTRDQTIDAILATTESLDTEAGPHVDPERLRTALDAMTAQAEKIGVPASHFEMLDAALAERIGVLKAAPDFVSGGRIHDLVETMNELLGNEDLAGIVDGFQEVSDESNGADLDAIASGFYLTGNALSRMVRSLGTQTVAIVGVAGVGKTHLAAALAKPTGDRPAGVLIFAREFGERFSDAQLAAALVPGQSDIDLALDALNDTALRKGARIPIVIDGLSESGRPADWQDLLARLKAKLVKRPMIVLVLTVRPDYAGRCLPATVRPLRLSPFSRSETRRAVRRYFEYYRIDAGAMQLPWLELSNPLLLSIFCRAINPERVETVSVAEIPVGPGAIFDLFNDRSAQRIADRDGLDPSAIRAALSQLAKAFWEQNARSLPQAKVKEALGDDPMEWDRTLTNKLLSEGVLTRSPPRFGEDDDESITFVFDALAGHVIAKALLAGGTLDFNDDATVARFVIGDEHTHPFAEDVVASLDRIFAAKGEDLVWARTDSVPLKSMSLVGATGLPSVQVTSQTTDAIASTVEHDAEFLTSLLPRIVDRQGWAGDPFNAYLLDRLLLPMNVWQRDLIWTEWVRQNDDEVVATIDDCHASFRDHRVSDPETANLVLRYLSWLLTSTSRTLRDRATETITEIGRQFPAQLFALTIERLRVNDPYVSERLFAACYGVAMANSRPGPEYTAAASEVLERLVEEVVRTDEPVSHWLMREHTRGILDLALQHQSDLAPPGLTESELLSMPIGPSLSALNPEQAEELVTTVQMDFGNYTIGRLSPGRGNYDDGHEGHRRITAEILARIWDLGWRPDRFEEIDGDLSRFSRDNDPERVERYGKKYGWIGFYEAAGREDAAGRLVEEWGEREGERERLSDIPIDPSFPRVQLRAPARVPSWIEGPADAKEWVTTAKTEIPDSLLRVDWIGELEGPWVAVYGDLSQTQPGELDDVRRHVFALIRLALVPKGSWVDVAAWLTAHTGLHRDVLPGPGEDYYTYAGEIPWSEHFAEYLGTREHRERRTEPIRIAEDREVAGECLAHLYSWEYYHSVTNQHGGFPVPAPAFSADFDLLTEPNSLNQVLPDGSTASVSIGAPEGFEGQLVYIREDLLRSYAEKSEADIGILVWGDRSIRQGIGARPPEWMIEATQSGADVYRRVLSLDELAARG